MENQEQNARRMLWIIGGAILVAMIVVGGVLFALFGQVSNNQKSSTDNTRDNAEQIATQAEVKQDIEELDDSVEQLKEDTKAAETALSSNKKQVKVGN